MCGIYTPKDKKKTTKQMPLCVYSNTSATFWNTLESDLVFKLNPGPVNHGKQSSIILDNNSNKTKAPRRQSPLAFSLLNVRSVTLHCPRVTYRFYSV